MARISEDEYTEACENDLGFCFVCQSFTRGETEPDAEEYDCPECDQNTVFGAEQALLKNLVAFIDEGEQDV